MKKKVVFSGVMGVMTIGMLAGCGNATVPDQAMQKSDDLVVTPVDDIANKVDMLDDAQDDIANAVDTKNDALEDALDVLDEDITTTKAKAMNDAANKDFSDVPKDIDMSMAQSCSGATITTNHGVITVALDGSAAPIAVANFCTLAKKGFYDSVIFHRVINQFMIQGGDPDGIGTGGPGYKFRDELPAQGAYKVGSLAMANAGPNTNGSQFFIVSGQNGVSLPPLYTLFGQVTAGLDVVEKIQNVETLPGDKPVEDVVIESIVLTTK